MNPRIRNGIIIIVVGTGLVVAGIFVLTRIIRQSLAPLPQPDQPTPFALQVVVTTHDIALGSVLRPSDVTVISIPVEAAPRNTFGDVDDVIERLTKVSLVAGEMVLEHNLIDPTNINHDQAFVLGENQVLMAFQPGDLMTGLGIIERGDIVDILVTLSQSAPLEQEGEEELVGTEEQPEAVQVFTFDAFQLVEVTAMVVNVVYAEQEDQPILSGTTDDPPPTPEPEIIDRNIAAYLLALTPQDALLLKHLTDQGADFDLVLRNPTTTKIFDLTPVTEDFLIDKYQLEISR